VAALVSISGAQAVVEVEVQLDQGRRPISPYLFGRNSFAAELPPEVVVASGLRLVRDSHGNNNTKYNWRQDVSSHPDWYNNVYPQGLHERAARLSSEFGDLQVLYGLPVLGRVATLSGATFNFSKNDGWQGPGSPTPDVRQNLAAGGDASKYTIPWTARDSVDMLDFFFAPKPEGLGLDRSHFRYIHLDNEPEVWSGTHDDVMPVNISAEECMQRYIAVARELKSRHPDLRAMAPGFTSEWQWWNWDNNFVDGLPWMEYFVKRMAEESRLAGARLLDVVDFHTYVPGELTDAQLLQQHRIFYDPDYISPQANGVKRYPDGGWDENQRVMRVFGRMEEWLDEHFGPEHGITLGITEAGPGHGKPPMVYALWYASMLGTFADHGIEVFTPWEWHDNWWEVLHLFSIHGKPVRVETTSSDEEIVSAYASTTPANDAVTVILVNRDPAEARSVRLAITGAPTDDRIETLTLADANSNSRTFVSAEQNAITRSTTIAREGVIELVLAPYSITAVKIEP
jgi:hypothetical protein